MRNPFARFSRQTLGERRFLLAHLATGCFGAALALVVVLRLDPSAMFERSLSWYEWWILVSGFAGGVAGIWLAKDRLGRTGLRDPLIGLAIVTGLGAIVGGTLALPLYGTMFGPFTLAVIFAASPLIAGLWLANTAAAHILLRSWHSERDSIFGAEPPVPLLTTLRRLLAWRPGRPLSL